jgi:NAD(P)-dependent dehydrogenase (short-subunit alcohol dehydrogenase family)
VICPAVIETPMGERIFGAADVRPVMEAMHPLGRFGKPMEVAEAVLWMCSERASFMTGQSLILDGGLLAGRGPGVAASATASR